MLDKVEDGGVPLGKVLEEVGLFLVIFDFTIVMDLKCAISVFRNPELFHISGCCSLGLTQRVINRRNNLIYKALNFGVIPLELLPM